MKICIAQTRPVKGDIEKNIEAHKKFTDTAASTGADIIIFPELSITGYEPELAKELVSDKDDKRFDVFQEISDAKKIVIGIGMPIRSNSGITISMLIFQPGQARQIYSKYYLHADEEVFFVRGENYPLITIDEVKIALAICYELSIPEHSENAFKNKADVYLVSVAKKKAGVERAYKSLSEIAKKYSMTVLMSNCIGGDECVGGSAVWNNKGELVKQMDEMNEGMVIFDTENEEVREVKI